MSIKYLIILFLLGYLFKAEAQEPAKRSLIDCLNEAVKNNDQFLKLKSDEKIKRLEHRMVKSQLIPSLTAGINSNEYIQDSRIAFIDDIIPASEINDAKTSGFSNSLNASVNLTDFVQSFANIKASKLDREAYSLDLTIQLNQLIQTVTNLYFSTYEQQEKCRFLSQKKEASEELMRISQLKLKLGAIDSLTYYQALLNLELDDISLRNAQTEYERSISSLRIWMNTNEVFELDQPELEIKNLKSTGPFPEIVALDLRIENQKVSKRALNWNYLPDFTLFSGYGYSNQTFQNGLVAQNRAIGTSYGLTLNYNFGSIKNNLHQQKISKLRIENTQLSRDRILKERKRDAELLDLELANSQLNLSAIERSVSIAIRAYNNATTQYELGGIDLVELRRLQNQLSENQINLVQAKTQYSSTQLKKAALYGNLETILAD